MGETAGAIIAGVAALMGGVASGVGAAQAARIQGQYAADLDDDDRWFVREMTDRQDATNQRVFEQENAEYDRRFQMQSESQKELLEWLQNNFNSPSAQAAALRKAGLSPSVIFGNGQNPFGDIGLPEVSSPASPSFPNTSTAQYSPHHAQYQAPNIGASIGQGIQSAASMATEVYSSLSQSAQVNVDTEQKKQFFGYAIEQMQLQNASLETKNAFDRLTYEITEKYGDKKAAAELNGLIAAAYNANMSGDNFKFQSICNKIQASILERKDKLDGATYGDIGFWSNYFIQCAEYDVKMRKASYKTELGKPAVQRSEIRRNNSAANADDARAEWLGALTKTENELRSGRVEALSLSNDIATLQKFLIANDLKFSDVTLAAKTAGFMADMNTKIIGSQIAQEELYRIQTKNKWLGAQEFADYCLKWSYVFNNVVSSFTTMRGQNMRFETAKERNAFQHEFNQMWERTKMSDVKNAMNGKRGVGDIFEHVPDADKGYYENMWMPNNPLY